MTTCSPPTLARGSPACAGRGQREPLPWHAPWLKICSGGSLTRPSGLRRLLPRPSSGSRWPRNAGLAIPRRGSGGPPRAPGSSGARPAWRAGASAGVLNYGGANREMDVRDFRGAAFRPAGALQGVQAGGQAELGRQCSLRPRVQVLPRAPLPTCAPEELALGSASEGGASVVGAIPARRAEESHPAGAGRAPAANHSVLRCHGARQARTSARARGGDRTGMRRRLAWAADAPDGRYFAAADIPKGLRRWVKPRRTQAGGVHRARARRLLGEGAASAGGRVGASCRGLHAAIRVPAVAGGGAPVLR